LWLLSCVIGDCTMAQGLERGREVTHYSSMLLQRFCG
jgi:hypothetical protein